MTDVAGGATVEAAAAAAADESALSQERPFPGLRPFAFEDRAFFFGREKQAFALYRLVENGRFIAVVGSSGSGKSSLVLAGLQGLLADETADPGGPSWVCLSMRPGGAPMSRLARALARLSENDSPDDAARRRERVDYCLRQSSFSFESALEEAGGLKDRTLLLIVDQFEELFRFGLAGLGPRRGGLEETRARDEATQFVQILLDADRRRLKDVRVLITMRSDFIGDCAYFHGLSEAVSATQYLVPNLTRSQLEDAIRKPIEKAGAEIEPELVERLINDCGAELDQLPVLQHCLMRLWDRAGATGAKGPRRLTRETYADIGGMAEALSRHADEILALCTGAELAAEQAFRALSELDREGRAIRRALRFDRLLAETGVPEAALRRALDRFRAETCSFLLPPLSLAPALQPDDRIDVGHEALLRRWKKLAGDRTVNAATGRPALGWLGDERADGERYRTLVSLVEGEAHGDGATLTEPERTRSWWRRLPRTPAWAERYGGKFDEVKRLIADSIADKRRARNRRILGVGAAGLAALGVAGLVMVMQIDRAKQEAEAARQKLEAADTGAMTSAKTMLSRVLKAYSNQTLSLAGAKSVAEVAEDFLKGIHQSQQTGAANAVWAESLGLVSDLEATSLNFDRALALAEQQESVALALAAAAPTDPNALQLAYDASIRVGTVKASQKYLAFEEAEQKFIQAEQFAQRLVALSVDQRSEGDLVNARLKLGDIPHIHEQEDKALERYRSALDESEKALARLPDNPVLQRLKANAHFRIAEALKAKGASDESKAAYRAAMTIQSDLTTRNPDDRDIKSNLAASYTHLADVEQHEGDLVAALADYRAGVRIDEELIQGDPSNPTWQTYVAPLYKTVADILIALDRPKEAQTYYERNWETRLNLALRDRSIIANQVRLAEAAKALGDHTTGLPRIDAYRAATRTWKRLIDNPRAKTKTAPRYDDLMAFARVFDAERDWPDAQTAYKVAEAIARQNLEADPADASWQAKVEAAVAGAAAAAAAPGAGPPSNGAP